MCITQSTYCPQNYKVKKEKEVLLKKKKKTRIPDKLMPWSWAPNTSPVPYKCQALRNAIPVGILTSPVPYKWE